MKLLSVLVAKGAGMRGTRSKRRKIKAVRLKAAGSEIARK